MARKKESYIFTSEKKKSGFFGNFLMVVLMLLAIAITCILLNAASNSKLLLNQEKVSIMSLDKTYEGFSVLHISDLHASSMGQDHDMWKDLLNTRTYHAVVLSGDMVGLTGDYAPLVSLIEILTELNAKAPIYFIAGDEDPAPIVSTVTSSELAPWVQEAQKAGAIYLDAPISQAVGKKTVWFVPEYLYSIDASGMASVLEVQKTNMEADGRQYDMQGAEAYQSLGQRIDTMNKTAEAIKTMLSTDIQIAVSHVPLDSDYIRTSIEWADTEKVFNFRNISLLLAGHYCGGQWRVPRQGPLYVPEFGWMPEDDGIVGMQRVNSINQYISGGIGASDIYPMKGRMFNTPSITILKLTARIE